MEEHTCSWLKGKFTMYNYKGFWNNQTFNERVTLVQQNYKPHSNSVLLCSCPKTGTTWLKALAFAIVTRKDFGQSVSPLLTVVPHDCVPFLETNLEHIIKKQKSSDFPLVATHLPYSFLPESIIDSNCKIVYIYRNIKDVIVSNYHFSRELVKLSEEEAPFEGAFNDFCQGISWCGPYWDHILGYWRSGLERPETILFLKYEDMKKDATRNVEKLAEFIGYPFSVEEKKAGVVENIINLCSFQNLSGLQVNKRGKYHAEGPIPIENRLFFRKSNDGDWKNYFTNEMEEKIDKLIDEKLSDTGLVLK